MKVKQWMGAIDTACDRSAEAWMLKQRRREAAAYRRGYADAAVGTNRIRKVAPVLRKFYRDGHDRRVGEAAARYDAEN